MKPIEFKNNIALEGTTIREAANILQHEAAKIVLVCAADGHLVGTVTDGDIRRAVAGGVPSDLPLSAIMNKSPLVAGPNADYWAIQAQMRDNILRCMPQVDESGKIARLHVLHGTGETQRLPNTVVLMAGGLGMRLRPLTETMPKPLLKVGGKPVLQHTLEHFISQGFNNFLFSVNYLGHMIEEYFQDGARWNVKIDYLRETRPMGTAGALSLAPPQEHPIIVMNGDIISKVEIADHIEDCTGDTLAIVGVREYSHTVPFGCLDVSDGRILRLVEKPTSRYLINAGIYILSPEALTYLPENARYDMPSLLESIISDDKSVTHFVITEEWVDVGSVDDLTWARQLYKDQG